MYPLTCIQCTHSPHQWSYWHHSMYLITYINVHSHQKVIYSLTSINSVLGIPPQSSLWFFSSSIVRMKSTLAYFLITMYNPLLKFQWGQKSIKLFFTCIILLLHHWTSEKNMYLLETFWKPWNTDVISSVSDPDPNPPYQDVLGRIQGFWTSLISAFAYLLLHVKILSNIFNTNNNTNNNPRKKLAANSLR
jgi:hypothetical protein